MKFRTTSSLTTISLGILILTISFSLTTNETFAQIIPDCPPGPPDTGVVEKDHFPTSIGEIEIDGVPGFDDPVLITLEGAATICVFFEGGVLGVLGDADDDDDNDLDEVQTEIVQMELTGSSSLGDLTVRAGTECPSCQESLGEIEENEDNTTGKLDVPVKDAIPQLPGTADSFFDVFFEIEVAGMTLHNEVAMRIEATIPTKPPTGITYVKPESEIIPLLLPDGSDSGITIVQASHTPDPIPTQVGGEYIPIDTTAMLVSGVQINAAWLIPVIVSAVGIGLLFVRKMNYRTKN